MVGMAKGDHLDFGADLNPYVMDSESLSATIVESGILEDFLAFLTVTGRSLLGEMTARD